MIKIAILTNHLLYSDKKANIHIIYDILNKNSNYEVDFITYPVSLAYFAKRNRYKLKALFKGLFKQKFLFTLFQSSPKLKKYLPEIIFDKLLNTISDSYDILICEGGNSSIIFDKLKYKKLIYRMSDHPDYCALIDKAYRYENILAQKADIILSVLKYNLHSELTKFRYLANPSIYDGITINNNKLNECVYVGSNKLNNKVILNLAKNGIKIHIYSEDIKISHENIIFHNLIPKEKLVDEISKYRIGLIPFELDNKNTHMEIPLKTYDYLASGLKIFMLTSSLNIKTEVIDVYHNEKEYILNIKKYLDSNEEIDIQIYNKFIQQNSIEIFEKRINEIIKELND